MTYKLLDLHSHSLTNNVVSQTLLAKHDVDIRI